MQNKTLVTFGDSWPQGSELLHNEKAFGELVTKQLKCKQFKNYAHPASSINHLPVQLKSFMKMFASTMQDLSHCIAIFSLTGTSRSMIYDKDGLWMFQNPSGGYCGPTQDKQLCNYIDEHYWKFVYSPQLCDVTNNTTLISLQTICANNGIQDYYVNGWESIDFWNDVDITKIYKGGTVTCKDLANKNLAEGGHPNQLGHQLIADALTDWITNEG